MTRGGGRGAIRLCPVCKREVKVSRSTEKVIPHNISKGTQCDGSKLKIDLYGEERGALGMNQVFELPEDPTERKESM